MAQPVVHWEVSVNDYAKGIEFYSKLFSWDFQKFEGADYSVVAAAGEKSIGGGIGPAQKGQKPTVTFYVQVDDLQAYLDKAESLGGKTIAPPTPIPGVGSSAMFADPDGNLIGLFSS